MSANSAHPAKNDFSDRQSSVLSEPPSDLDDQDSPFPSSPTQESTPRPRAKTDVPPPGTAYRIANMKIMTYGGELKSPQEIWEERYNSQPAPPEQSQRKKDEIFFMKIIQDAKDEAREDRTRYLEKLARRDKEIQDLKGTVARLKGTIRVLKENIEELEDGRDGSGSE